MDIQYEDTATCLPCWGTRNLPSSILFKTETKHPDSQLRSSQRSVKLSLKKYKEYHKTQGSTSYRFSCQQPHQKRASSFIRIQQKQALHRPSSHRTQPRQNSHVTEEKNVKVNFNQLIHRAYENNKVMVCNHKAVQVVKGVIRFEQTTKSCKTYQPHHSKLYQTNKVIPGTKFSLQQLSNMKQSLHSISQGEQRVKIQESIIMMDYFNPSTSRIEQLKFISQSQRDSQVQQKL